MTLPLGGNPTTHHRGVPQQSEYVTLLPLAGSDSTLSSQGTWDWI